MSLFLENFIWMIENVALASVAVVFGLVFLKAKNPFVKFVFFIFWLLFLPNTIYLITDVGYLPEQLKKVQFTEGILLFLQLASFVFFGFLTYFVAMIPLEEMIKKAGMKKDSLFSSLIILLTNFLIGFAVVVGKTLRDHSWYVFLEPVHVFSDFLTVLKSTNLTLLSLFFGLLFNLIYFVFKNKFHKIKSK